MTKITIIAPFSFGYIDQLVSALERRNTVQVTYFNTHDIKFSYSSVFQRAQNFFSKNFLRKNMKTQFRCDTLEHEIGLMEKQDYILVIRPDWLTIDFLTFLKQKTDSLISYYFDAIANFPVKRKLIPYFDKVYSYEKEDVAREGLHFITNYYDKIHPEQKDFEFLVYNISSYDYRFGCLQKIAKMLHESGHHSKFIVRKEKPIKSDYIELSSNYIPISETKKHLAKSRILLDIQKRDQKGLTFRMFEALAFQKKLITTNTDVVNYDFYDPRNILVIDFDNPIVPDSFLEDPYHKVPDEILVKYSVDHWIDTVFSHTG
ncbi:hypothetical protein [Arenibacter certesii]|uniref:Lipopolysaccharide biosynthesis protein n=1 Tax=Arenibacter certesii TaxID=228955 RepID=A0A918J588_9FLAO|nr:hypothetical protein [Arenibacter certesii]GGW49180.1 hypothetical protein GCM10007383_36430 [Arenibacter certesii]